MSNERSAGHRAMETVLVVFKDPRLELHHPVPSQPKEIVAMRHLARYDEPDDNGTSSSTLTTTPTTPAQPRRAPDHGEPPAADYFAADFSWRAEFGARPDWCPGQDPSPEPEPTPETSSAPLPLTQDADLFDGLYGVAEHPKRIDSAAFVSQGGHQHQHHHHHHHQPQGHERSQAYAYDGQGHGASQAYAYAGKAHGASQSRPRHHHYEYRPSYSDGDYECSCFSRRSAAPPAAATASTTHQQQQQHARRHQPSNSLVLRNVHDQDRLSPFEWRVFNETRIHEDE